MSKLLLIFLASSLVSCGCLKAPKVYPKQILKKYNICKEYKAGYGEKFYLEFEKNIPIEECLKDGSWVLTNEEMLEIRQKYYESKQCYDDRALEQGEEN